MNAIPLETAAAAQPGDTSLLDRTLLAAFLENVPDFVHFKDRQGRFIAVSRSKLQRNGLQHPGEIIGKTDFDFFAPANAQRAFDDEEQVMRTGTPLVGKEERVKWADGRETWAVVNKCPLRDEQGAIIGTFGLTRDVTKSKVLELALEKAQNELIEASRLAGMSEVATGVLHNVGNVLNSLNVSATVIADTLRQSKAESLAKISSLLREHSTELGPYLTEDPKGRLVPGFIESLARHLQEDQSRLVREIESLRKNVDHIKEIVAMQQSYATMIGVVEPLDATTLVEDALSMNFAALARHDVQIERDFHLAPRVLGERGKILQVLVNLIRNAKYAVAAQPSGQKLVTVRLLPAGDDRVQIIVQDNGAGILPENLTRIFQHGFTTKPTGHGFGLHSSALAARDMKGTLTAHSDGPGRGATFVLDLPAATA